MRQDVKHSPEQVHRPQPIPARGQEPLAFQAVDLSTLQRTIANPALAKPADILGLQRAAGNRAVTRLIQAKPTGGAVHDTCKQEADCVAEQVVDQRSEEVRRKNASLIQRNGDPPTEERQPRRGSLRLSGYRQTGLSIGQPQQAVVSPGPRPQHAVETIMPPAQHATLISPAPRPQHATLVSPGPQQGMHVPPAIINLGPGRMPQNLPPSAKRVLEIGRARGLSRTQLQNTDVSEGGGKLESAKNIVDMGGAPIAATDDRLVEAYRGAELKESGSGMPLLLPEGAFWVGAGVLSGVSGILGLAQSMKTLVSSEADTWEKVQAAFDYAATGADVTASAEGLAGGVSQIVYKTTGSDLAGATSSWCLGFQTMFSTLSKGIQTIKGVVELVKMIVSRAKGEKYGRDEWLARGSAVLNNALATAAGVVASIRSIYEAIGGAVTGMFSNVIPGLDIAVSAVKSIMQGYYLTVSAVQIHRMRQRKNELQAKLLRKSNDPGLTKQVLKQASNVFATYEGQLATVDDLIAKNNDKIKAIEKANKGTKSQAQIEKLRQENKVLTDRKADINKAIAEHERLSHVSRKRVGELRLAGELRYTNIKRVTRQSIHIVTNLVQVGASIATLVSGPGAPAALALKASAAGIDTSLPFFRWVKQHARDYAAKRETRGGSPVSAERPWLKMRTDKSSAAKLQERKREAVMILVMASKLNQYIPQGANPSVQEIAKLKKHADRVENYIRATGCPPEKLYRSNGKPQEQVKILVKELAKREFLEG